MLELVAVYLQVFSLMLNAGIVVLAMCLLFALLVAIVFTLWGRKNRG